MDEYLAEEFERRLYEAAIQNLHALDNPLRFNNFAYAFRELTRHILKRVAPDEKVLGCSWYVNETDKPRGITRKQRAYYASQGGLSDDYVTNVLQIDVSKTHSELVKSINRLSKYTHIEENVFDMSDVVIDDLASDVIQSASDFMDLISDLRESVISRVWDVIDREVLDGIISETLISVDEIASHHFVEVVYTEEIIITDITDIKIEFTVHGSLDCELQWGSGSDFRRGDGVALPINFPFSCNLYSLIEQPERIAVEISSIQVDTSSWYGDTE